MIEVETIEKSLGCIVEEDVEGIIRFKYRVFPTEKLITLLKFENTKEEFTDTFYDDENFSFGKANKYNRKRNDVCIEQQSCDANDMMKGLNRIRQARVDSTKFNMLKEFLTFKFTRQMSGEYPASNVVGKLVAYIDTLQEPICFQVVTFSMKVEDVSGSLLVNFLKEILCLENSADSVEANMLMQLPSKPDLVFFPFFSKFIYCLQLSRNWQLYNEVFKQYDPMAVCVCERLRSIGYNTRVKGYFGDYTLFAQYLVAHFNIIMKKYENKKTIDPYEEVIKNVRESQDYFQRSDTVRYGGDDCDNENFWYNEEEFNSESSCDEEK